ncbi:MAG: alpha-galactosidase, partial [Actinomycetota bacterium]
PSFTEATVTTERSDSGGVRAASVELTDRFAELSLRIDLVLDGQVAAPASADQTAAADVLQMAVALTNTGTTEYRVDRLVPSVSLPAWATELLTFTGRWTLELQQQRHDWRAGIWSSENRRGRTSHDRPPALFVGTAGFTETTGEVWGLQLGWSGNSRVVAERLSDGRRHIQMGEYLYSGEVVLAPGETLHAPTVYGAYSASGLGEASRAFHRFVRSRAHHPGPDRPRPVILNTWEAIYFDHDVDTLKRLASLAAEVGVERFVLDDGWFLGRNDDSAALGDWVVDPQKYPNGLHPLVDHVRSLGMDFGLWFEPEMVNPDSELYRAHPEWALHDPRYPTTLARHQLVLDLANPDAFAHIRDRLDLVLSEYEISYVKWDMNRDLVRPTLRTGDGAVAGAGARAQTLAFYSLLDELRRRHPDVEFESCSSGGGRADLEALARTERIWVSDSNDAQDRQAIQRGFSMLFPPEVMGAHIGPPRSHTTGRQHNLGFRGASAMLGHLGIEWNLLDTNERDRARLAAIIGHYKQHRHLVHGGDWYRLDRTDPAANTMGVVAADRSEALFVHARTGTALESVQLPVRFDGLDPDRLYRVSMPELTGPVQDRGVKPPPWTTTKGGPDTEAGDGPLMTGRVLMRSGLPLPVLDPESAVMLHLLGQ